MMSFLCENCGSKFRSVTNWIDQPCQNVDPNGLECGFPIAPILNLQIKGIEKEVNVEQFTERYGNSHIDFCKVCGPDYDCSCNIVDCSGLSDADIDQLKKVLAGRNK